MQNYTVLLFEQLQGVGFPGQQGTYSGSPIGTNGFSKSASPSSALTFSSFFFP